MNNFEKKNSTSNYKQTQKYSGLMSSIIKSKVKREIFDIRKQKNFAARKLLDQLEENLSKELKQSESNNSNFFIEHMQEGSEISFNELILKLLRTNRKDWEDFLVHLAENFDATALSCFGTNLLYGGFMTSTLNNSPRCRFADFPSQPTSKDILTLQNSIKDDLRKDRRVCIIRGYKLLNENLLKLCRFFADTAFILIDKEPSIPSNYMLYNVLYIPESDNTVLVASSNCSLLYGVAILFPGKIETKNNFQSNLSSLFRFLSSPNLPIKSSINDFYNAICRIEYLTSEGKNTKPIMHNEN